MLELTSETFLASLSNAEILACNVGPQFNCGVYHCVYRRAQGWAGGGYTYYTYIQANDRDEQTECNQIMH